MPYPPPFCLANPFDIHLLVRCDLLFAFLCQQEGQEAKGVNWVTGYLNIFNSDEMYLYPSPVPPFLHNAVPPLFPLPISDLPYLGPGAYPRLALLSQLDSGLCSDHGRMGGHWASAGVPWVVAHASLHNFLELLHSITESECL